MAHWQNRLIDLQVSETTECQSPEKVRGGEIQVPGKNVGTELMDKPNLLGIDGRSKKTDAHREESRSLWQESKGLGLCHLCSHGSEY